MNIPYEQHVLRLACSHYTSPANFVAFVLYRRMSIVNPLSLPCPIDADSAVVPIRPSV